MNDQNPSRSLTPKEALNEGASYLVCGREVTEEGNPSENIKKIVIEYYEKYCSPLEYAYLPSGSHIEDIE